MTEEWRDIAGYDDYYQVSSFGRVKSLERYIQQSVGGNFSSKPSPLIRLISINEKTIST